MTSLVLIVASGAAWETTALTVLADRRDVVVLKRCVDVDDLLATATAGQADVAVVALDAPGLDAGAVAHLAAHGVHAVAVAAGSSPGEAGRLHAARIGVEHLVSADDLAALPDLVEQAGRAPLGLDGTAARTPGADGGSEQPLVGLDPGAEDLPRMAPEVESGRVIAVWGPTGAPGRSTLASALAAELAHRRRTATLVDADPYGGALAQQLGVLEEVSGLLAAGRLATGGQLAERLATVQRRLGPCLTLVTGLPRPDRWSELRPGAIEHLLELLVEQGHVVVDTGSSLEEDLAAELGGRPSRNQLTLATLDRADAVVVVGGADPVSLSRLARGLVELRERAPHLSPHVVVNRMRPSLGWSERDVAAMLAGYAAPASLHFVPEDRATVDRALVAGRTLRETDPDAPVVRAVAEVAATLVPDPVTMTGVGPVDAAGRPPLPRRIGQRVRRRTAGRARPR